ncbi:AAA family ATPase [uncultured Thiodictyon sp.]|uniref:ATP-dependent nuclease n=1 Tax=uncultured Thiodictyon sp. TaxID=1846217 RepID=UPI0025F896E1|nr:AAA family ATPase [uncultured Thiodictyon sp.]
MAGILIEAPLRLAGLGTRRLATLAIQKSGITEGAIVIVDEIEHGLEPHRIIGAIAQLKADQVNAVNHRTPVGQVLMTTHSDVALAEAGAESLRVVATIRPSRQATIAKPSSPSPIQALMRFTPRALFARRVLVTEGNTEIGMLLGIRENWPARHANKPIEQLGVAIADGNGEQACSMALALGSLGYLTAIYRDSDTTLSSDNQAALIADAISVFEYGSGLNTEQAIFSAANDDLVQELLIYARSERGDNAINDNLKIKIPELTIEVIRGNFNVWKASTNLNGQQLREAISEVAARKKWFKDQRIGRGLAPMVWKIAIENPTSLLAQAFSQVEAWLYA